MLEFSSTVLSTLSLYHALTNQNIILKNTAKARLGYPVSFLAHKQTGAILTAHSKRQKLR